MTVGELRVLLEGLPDDVVVAVEDVDGKCINIAGASVARPVLYLQSVQEFPEGWYTSDGLEVNYDYKD